MGKDATRFRHESMQDAKTVKTLLTALSKGFAKGELSLSDDGEELILTPKGPLTLRLKADRDEGRCRVDLRVSWLEENGAAAKNKPAPKVG